MTKQKKNKMSGEFLFAVKIRDLLDNACFLQGVRGDDTAGSLVKAGLEQRKTRLVSAKTEASSALLRLQDGTLVPSDVLATLFCEKGTVLHLVPTVAKPNNTANNNNNTTNNNNTSNNNNNTTNNTNAALVRSDVWVRLNVGGLPIVTTRDTLLRDGDSMLARMFGDDWPVEKEKKKLFFFF